MTPARSHVDPADPGVFVGAPPPSPHNSSRPREPAPPFRYDAPMPSQIRSHSRLSLFTRLLAAGTLTAGLAACGTEEASAMSKFADQMCACKDVACADKLFPEIEKLANANEGKEVVAAVADKYNNEMTRAEGCYTKLHEAADAAPAEPAAK